MDQDKKLLITSLCKNFCCRSYNKEELKNEKVKNSEP